MATYVISDIHGNLTTFKNLLKTINFSFENDELFLLGDYVDWGKESLNTLLYIMDLDEKYENIHILIGNHDLMFLEQIKSYNKNKFYLDNNWLYRNKGLETWKEYLNQDETQRKKIELYLDNLPYRAEIKVNGNNFIMAHACPCEEFVYDENLSKERNLRRFLELREDAVWTRIIQYIKYVAKWFNDDKYDFDYFICGHTISNKLKDNHIGINHIGDVFDIDFGAKVLGYEDGEIARLAALRLDDFEEFYEE